MHYNFNKEYSEYIMIMTKKTLSKKEQPLFSQNRMINIIWLKKFLKLRIQIKMLSQSFL